MESGIDVGVNLIGMLCLESSMILSSSSSLKLFRGSLQFSVCDDCSTVYFLDLLLLDVLEGVVTSVIEFFADLPTVVLCLAFEFASETPLDMSGLIASPPDFVIFIFIVRIISLHFSVPMLSVFRSKKRIDLSR